MRIPSKNARQEDSEAAAGERRGLSELLRERFGRGGEAVLTFLTCGLAVAVSGFAAYLLRQPLLFPSLGPTAFLFFESPMEQQASPRNTVIGHLVGVVAGFFSLALFGLLHAPSVLVVGVTPARIGAAALSLALTGSVSLLLRAYHPPAGATVLIVSLGLLSTPPQLVALMAGVVILTVAAWAINRALGIPAPIWSVRESN